MAELVDALGRTAPVEPQVVEGALQRLTAVGLAWPAGGSWRAVAGLSQTPTACSVWLHRCDG